MNQEIKQEVLHVRVNEATKVLWEGDAVSVSSENSDGKFDVLGLHSNFITLVRNAPITIVDVEGNEKKYSFKQSVIFVTDNTVKIFADIR
jgi:F0F1-type ATP synthase epsilon subunit